MNKSILFIVLWPSLFSHSSGNVVLSQSGTLDQSSPFRSYQDNHIGFTFKYPANYSKNKIVDSVYDAKERTNGTFVCAFAILSQKGRTDPPPARFFVYLMHQLPTSQNLSPFAPTANQIPTRTTLGANTFFYFGPGGGGVYYPDQFFIAIKEGALGFVFSGPSATNTPGPEIKQLERQVLSTLKLRAH